MAERVYNVLFLCTGNSARSIMAECILNRLGRGRFKAYSAGSRPTGKVNPCALDLLNRFNHPTEGLRSKDWAEFATADAPRIDFVITVCDRAVREVCPAWPGQPISAHWGFPDPARFRGSEEETRAVFADLYDRISDRVSEFAALPNASLDELSRKSQMQEPARKSAERP